MRRIRKWNIAVALLAAVVAASARAANVPAPHTHWNRLEMRVRHLVYKPVHRPDTLRLLPGDVAIDTHVHTAFSHDSNAAVEEDILQAAHRGLTAIAITDHNTMDGIPNALEAVDRLRSEGRIPAEFFIIPGEEITVPRGHVIALYLTRPIPPGLPAAETLARIHRQGGLAIAPHPMERNELGSLANTLDFDGVETMDAAEEANYLVAKSAAQERRTAFYTTVTKPRYGASDAHEARVVGLCFTILRNCPPTPDAVKTALYAGRTTPSDAPTLASRTRGVTNAAGWMTWNEQDMPHVTYWQSAPMLRVPLPAGTLTVKVNNGPALLYRRRF